MPHGRLYVAMICLLYTSTRSRLPVELVYQEQCPDKSAALRREWEIKGMRRAEKLALISGGVPG